MINGVAHAGWSGGYPVDARADARPLYVVPLGDTRVALDGPALCVEREEESPRLFPLGRLSCVYSSDRAAWTSEALLACAAAGVPVVFVDEDGTVVARVLGRPGARDEIYTRMVEFLMLPQAPGMYRHWREGLRLRAARWAGMKLGVPPRLRRPAPCREWINREAARLAGERGGERSGQWLRSLAFNWMHAHLQDLGFGRDSELGQAGEPQLAKDLTEILMWYLEPVRIDWLRRRLLAARRGGEVLRPPQQQDLVGVFESSAARAAVRGREITGLLHRWLVHEG